MDRVTRALGENDEDVLNMKAGIAGLVFGNWSDAEIAAAAVEMAQEARQGLADVMKEMKCADETRKD